MKYVYWMSMDWNIYTQVNQNHFAIVLLWELERAYNTPPIIWKLGFFIHTEYSGSLKLHLGMMVQHHSMRKGEKTVTILKRSIWEIHMYYIITMAIILFNAYFRGYICEVLSLLHTIHYNHYVLHYITACNVVCKISN